MRIYLGSLWGKYRIWRIFTTIGLTLLFLILTVTIVNSQAEDSEMRYWLSSTNDLDINLLYLYSVSLSVLSFVTPVIVFWFKMNKNSYEYEVSVPTSKKNIFLGRYYIGMINIAFSYTIAFIVSILTIFITKGKYFYRYDCLWMYYGMSLVAMALIYSYFTLVFSKANNVIDGIVCLILSIVGPLLCGNILISLVLHYANYGREIVYYYVYPFVPLEGLSEFVAYLAKHSEGLLIDQWLSLILMIVVEAGALVFFILSTFNIKVENVGNDSDSIVNYKLLIPLTFIPFAGFVNIPALNFQYIMLPLALIFTYFAYALYKREFKLSFRDWITFGIVALVETFVYIFMFLTLC